ncbi:MAG: lysophospholipid acyltransferase family protein [Rhodocyclaceae bacterium]|nr:lysophospholipid acyltransferase family protein [Rhodocyclaceae bacterium]
MTSLARLIRTAVHLLRIVMGLALGKSQKAAWSRQLLTCLGVRLQVTGVPLAGGLLVANHISWLDIFAINSVAPSVFVAKSEVRTWPVMGWICERTETFFMERGSRAAVAQMKECMVSSLQQGKRLCVFPEGTTSLGKSVLPFHGALFQSAIDAHVPVMPVVIAYSSQASAYVGDMTLWQSLLSVVAARRLTVHVYFLPAMEAEGDRRHLAHRAHTAISHHSQWQGST